MKELAYYAFILGFVHEEEFAILAFCINGTNCLDLMVVYALAVTMSLVAITLVSIKSYNAFRSRLEKYEKHFHKLFAIALLIVALTYLFRF